MSSDKIKESGKIKAFKSFVFFLGLIFLVGLSACGLFWGAVVFDDFRSDKKYVHYSEEVQKKAESTQATGLEKWHYSKLLRNGKYKVSNATMLADQYLEESVQAGLIEALVDKALLNIDSEKSAKSQEKQVLNSLALLKRAYRKSCNTHYSNYIGFYSLEEESNPIYQQTDKLDDLIKGTTTTPSIRRQYGLLDIHINTQCKPNKAKRKYIINELAKMHKNTSLFTKAKLYVIADMNGEEVLQKVIVAYVSDNDKAQFQQKVDWLQVNYQQAFSK